MSVNIEDVISKFPKRKADSHKGDLGHLLVIAGSTGYTGAAYLTSQAAILSGSGLVTLAAGKSIYGIMASKLTEVMVKPFFETRDASLSLLAEKELMAFSEKCSCLAVGPGISRNKETQNLVRNLIARVEKPVVLDADGINAFCGHADALKKSRAKLVLTPHAGELSRLTGRSIEDIEKERKDIALAFSREYNTVLILKGHETVVADPSGGLYVNRTGNAGMASGGTGDVLTGMAASFIGQGMSAFDASVLAVYYHGLAGDAALKEKGPLSLIATDLLDKLPDILRALG